MKNNCKIYFYCGSTSGVEGCDHGRLDSEGECKFSENDGEDGMICLNEDARDFAFLDIGSKELP